MFNKNLILVVAHLLEKKAALNGKMPKKFSETKMMSGDDRSGFNAKWPGSFYKTAKAENLTFQQCQLTLSASTLAIRFRRLLSQNFECLGRRGGEHCECKENLL